MKPGSLVAALVLTLAAGGGGYLLGRGGGERDRGASASTSPPAGGTGTGSAGPRPAAPLRVSAVVVKPEAFAETVASTGTLRAEEGVELQAEINGKVTAINFKEGSRVRAGELLVKLNDADLRATLARATTRRELALRREERISLLLKEGIANQEEYDTIINDVQVQEAEIRLTEAQIAKTEIRAPFDGVVGLRFVSEGAFVNASTRIATLQRIDNLKIDFSIPEKYAPRIRLGAPVEFTVAGLEGRNRGEIIAYDPRIDSDTRTILIRAVCPNPTGRLLPGAFAAVDLTLETLTEAILVPSIAVIPGVSERNVFVARDGVAERRMVEVGTRTESTVHILSGLKPGDVLITSGLQQMRAGVKVNPVFPDGLAIASHGSSPHPVPPEPALTTPPRATSTAPATHP